MKTLNIIVISSIAIMILIGGVNLVNSSMNKSEVVECNQWKSQAAEYNGFFLAHWQADQCKAHNIIINAPVK